MNLPSSRNILNAVLIYPCFHADCQVINIRSSLARSTQVLYATHILDTPRLRRQMIGQSWIIVCGKAYLWINSVTAQDDHEILQGYLRPSLVLKLGLAEYKYTSHEPVTSVT